MTASYYKSLATPVLRKMYERLRQGLASLPPEERPADDMDSLLQMRRELDRRTGIPSTEVNFEKYITD